MRTPLVVSFDPPWGEYLALQQRDLAPYHFADALVRADLGLTGIGLEINAGYYPHGSPQRPAIEYGRLLDQWSLLGLPLMVLLTGASSTENDPKAVPAIHVDGADVYSQDQDGTPRDRAGQSSAPQRERTASLLPLLLARSTVQVVLWNQLSDKPPHEFPHSGLFDGKQQAKPLLQTMRELRKNYLT